MTVAPGDGTGWPVDPVTSEIDGRLDDDQTVAELVPAEWASVELLDGLDASLGLSVDVGLTAGGSIVGVVDEIGDSWFTIRGPDTVTLIASQAVTTIRHLPVFSTQQTRNPRPRQSVVWRQWARQHVYLRVRLRDGQTVGGSVRRVGRDFVELLEHPGDRRSELGDRGVVVPFAAVVSARTSP